MSGFRSDEIRSDARFLEELAREEFSIDIVSGDRPLKQLDDLFNRLLRREKDPGVFAYLAHAFAASFGERAVNEIGGRWGATMDDGLQIEYIGNRRSIKMTRLCAARMLAQGAPLPVDPETGAALRFLADASGDEARSFETLYDNLKRESDSGGWRLTDAGWTINNQQGDENGRIKADSFI